MQDLSQGATGSATEDRWHRGCQRLDGGLGARCRSASRRVAGWVRSWKVLVRGFHHAPAAIHLGDAVDPCDQERPADQTPYAVRHTGAVCRAACAWGCAGSGQLAGSRAVAVGVGVQPAVGAAVQALGEVLAREALLGARAGGLGDVADLGRHEGRLVLDVRLP